METPPSTFTAPWGTFVRSVSAGATVLLAGIAVLEARVIPRDLLGGWPWWLGVSLPAAILLISLLFVVRGYSLGAGVLYIQRLLWQTELPLESLQAAWASPDAMSGSLRLFGNGGLYSLTGLFRNSRLGNYRAFATDPKRAVVLELERRKVVVTPDSPVDFLRQLQLVCPRATVSQPPVERATDQAGRAAGGSTAGVGAST